MPRLWKDTLRYRFAEAKSYRNGRNHHSVDNPSITVPRM